MGRRKRGKGKNSTWGEGPDRRAGTGDWPDRLTEGEIQIRCAEIGKGIQVRGMKRRRKKKEYCQNEEKETTRKAGTGERTKKRCRGGTRKQEQEKG